MRTSRQKVRPRSHNFQGVLRGPFRQHNAPTYLSKQRLRPHRLPTPRQTYLILHANTSLIRDPCFKAIQPNINVSTLRSSGTFKVALTMRKRQAPSAGARPYALCRLAAPYRRLQSTASEGNMKREGVGRWALRGERSSRWVEVAMSE
jgi:hypothetical protein